MRRPHLSTGAWIFATAVTVAVIAPTAVYAAATSVVAIGDTSSSNTVAVTAQHQLLTAPIAPRQVIRGAGQSGNGYCQAIYTPPAGKAVVVTSVTYDLGSGSPGTFGYLMDANCVSTGHYDVAHTSQPYDTMQHNFPTGLPMPSVGAWGATGYFAVWMTGYLIPASQLPATAAIYAPPPAHPLNQHP